MKKTLAIILALVLALVLAGCSADKLEEKINSVADSIETGADELEDKLNSAADSLEAGVDSLEDKLNGVESEPEEQTEEPEQASEEAPAEEQEQTSEEAPAEDGIRPEIKEAIDSYEEFFSEYADFMKNYDASDVSALGDYLSTLEQYTETMQKLDDMENADLTDEETVYLTQATLRIDQMLLEAAG